MPRSAGSSARPYSLTNPHPDHEPRVDRTRTGSTMRGGRTYGTTLKCSCGWVPGYSRTTQRTEGANTLRVSTESKVCNEAPSAGGKQVAAERYRIHVEHVLDLEQEGWKRTNPANIRRAFIQGLSLKVKRYDQDEALPVVDVKVEAATTAQRRFYDIVLQGDDGTRYLHTLQHDKESVWWVDPESVAQVDAQFDASLPEGVTPRHEQPVTSNSLAPWQKDLIEKVNETGGFVSETDPRPHLVTTCPRPDCQWTATADTFVEAGALREEHMTNGHYNPEVEKRVGLIEGQLGWKVTSLARDLDQMAEHFEDRAKKLRALAERVREEGPTWAPPGFNMVAREYAHAVSHNSNGLTSSLAASISELEGYATTLTVLKPERHAPKEGS